MGVGQLPESRDKVSGDANRIFDIWEIGIGGIMASLVQNRICPVANPFGHDASQVRVENHTGLCLQYINGLEIHAKGGAFSREPPIDGNDLLLPGFKPGVVGEGRVVVVAGNGHRQVRRSECPPIISPPELEWPFGNPISRP